MNQWTHEQILAELEKADGSGAFASIILDSATNVAEGLAKAAHLSKQLKQPVAFVHDNKVFFTDGEGNDPLTGKSVAVTGGGMGHIRPEEVTALLDVAKPPLRADGEMWQQLLERPDDHLTTIALLNGYYTDALRSSERGGNAWTKVVQRAREHKDEHAEAIVLMEPYLSDALTASERKAFVTHITKCPGCHDRVVTLQISNSVDNNKQPPDKQHGF
jgi:hypothetical protein